MDIRKGKLIICTEEYTSKTCGSCGRLNHNLGSNKVFKCPYEDCKYLADRDINAARNIFIMNYKMVSSNLLEDILPEPPGRT
jgi:transposase